MEITIIFMVVVAVLAIGTYLGHKQKKAPKGPKH